jgi:UbiD family decarboxylase
MPFADLREFLDRLEEVGELSRVEVEVDPEYEIGAICRHAADLDGPAILFERPRGHTVPVVANLLAAKRRSALALECTLADLVPVWRERVAHPIPPRIVSDGPCKENVLVGDAVDLYKLPIPLFNELDSAPFVTAGCHISRDPQTGARNVGVYRNQVHGPRLLGVSIPPFRHLRLHEAQADPEASRFPVAIAVGVDPAVYLAAVAAVPLGVDELALAGALRGAPVELVRCETIPLEVPASAEIVLECEMLRGELKEEGPFGEFTGYYCSPVPRPVLEVKAITYRNNLLYQAIYIGKPPNESVESHLVMNEADIMAEVGLPGLRAIHLSMGGSGFFNAVASIDKRFEGYGKMMAMAILGTWAGRGIKTLIIVDSDVAPDNPTEVEWALATRVQPDRDVEILKHMTGAILDPSLPKQEREKGTARTSKMIIDATRFDAAEYEKPVLPQPQVYERVRREWAKYGIGAGSGTNSPG